MSDRYNQKWTRLFTQDGSNDNAITIGQTAYYSCPEEYVGDDWRAHEDHHKRQWAREGRVRFAITYLWWHFTRGYDNNPYEHEAQMMALKHKLEKRRA